MPSREGQNQSYNAKERGMCERLIAEAQAFYEKPQNMEAFKAWLNENGGLDYETNNIDVGL